MIGKSILLTVSLVLFSASAAWSMTVSDPTSYGYFVEQIKQMEQQISEMEKQYDKMKETYEEVQEVRNEIEDTKNQLMGMYNRGASLVGRAKKLQAAFESRPSTLEDQAKKWLKLESDVRDFVGAESVIDDLFHDPRQNREDVYKTLEKRYGAKQKALKRAIIESDIAVSSMGERLKVVEELSLMIDDTENLKDATDLTNRILVEILTILDEQFALSAHLGQATTMMQFTGVSDDEQKKHTTKQKTPKYPHPADAYLEKRGIDVDTMTQEDFMNLLLFKEQ